MDIRSPVKLNGNELRNAHVETLTADPSLLTSADNGRVWYRSDTKQLKFYDGSVVHVVRDGVTLITSADIQDGTITDADVAAANKDGTTGTPSMRTLGSGAQQALAGTTRLDQIAVPTADISLNTHKLTNVVDPSGPQDAATKAYVDASAQGLDVKQSVRVAAGAGTSGSNVATVTTASGAATAVNLTTANGQLDGIQLVVGDRILLFDSAAPQTWAGIYTVTGGTGSSSGSLTVARATDANTSAEVTAGLFVFVEDGSFNSDSGWVLTTNNPITLNTTTLQFAQFSGAGQITAGAGLTKFGNLLDVGAGPGIAVAADSVGIENAGVLTIAHGGTGASTAAAARTALGIVGRYATSFGDGGSLSFTIPGATHGFGTGDLIVQVFDQTVSPRVQVFPDVSINQFSFDVTLAFSTPPALLGIRVVVIG